MMELSAISYQLSAISYQLSAISYQLSAISYQLSAMRCQISASSVKRGRVFLLGFYVTLLKETSSKRGRLIADC
jgi:hypothetical protein